ncbi:hypothetical protein M446_6728 [Methylobacterium sp. 4-46]|uniref:DUF5681 domain-containing protein n=1 Tax=unclassified Methylobacterium TaxID=2615210 RepID=UPI000152D41E|nr:MULTISPECIES: DUF5681 domain-containing protein [Methylobacterium]ACA20978.1 hypothetical protein M446_6728 [Methylobacterium sp. 4-46]WFT80133.1 DUF5681 domain-containing protein [Methylobacterium nodulans]
MSKPGTFTKGKSGNPAGRPKGARHKTTLAMEALLAGEAEGLTRRAVELAHGGDTVALRLCLDRLLPVRKDRPVSFALPPIEGGGELTRATAALIEAVARGDLTPSEAAEFGKLIELHVKAMETYDFAARLEALEAGMARTVTRR